MYVYIYIYNANEIPSASSVMQLKVLKWIWSLFLANV